MKLSQVVVELEKNPQRKFKHVSWERFWMLPEINMINGFFGVSNYVLDNNWELETESKNLTIENLQKAWDTIIAPSSNLSFSERSPQFELFVKKLGFDTNNK